MTPAQGKLFSEEYRRRADAVETAFPLSFLGQFNLAELSAHAGFDAALPGEGRLLVFYDFLEQAESFSPAASVGWRVLWDATPAAALVRAPVPEALSSISDEEWTCVFRAAPASAQTVYADPDRRRVLGRLRSGRRGKLRRLRRLAGTVRHAGQ